jgi:hypothetical protein
MKYESIINDFYDQIYIENDNKLGFNLDSISRRFKIGEKIEKKE